MRKIIVFLMAAMLMAFQSCKETQFGILYSISADGDAAGDVALTFPNGEFSSNGQAVIKFKWSNDTTTMLEAVNAITLEEAYKSNDKKVVEAAQAADAWVDANFSATSLEGSYYVHIVGYVEETATQIKLSIDRVFTNR